MSFPLKDSDAYIESTGKRSTLGKKLSGGGYDLPTASNSTKGGVKIGSGLTMVGEVLTATQVPSHTGADAGKVLTVGDNGELEWDDNGGEGGEIIPDVPAQYQKVEYVIFGPNDENQFIKIPSVDAGTEIHCKYRALAFGEKGIVAIHNDSDESTSSYDFELYNDELGQSPILWSRTNSTVSFDEIQMKSVSPLVLNASTNNFDILTKFTVNISTPIEGSPNLFFRVGSYNSTNHFNGYLYYVSFKNKVTDSYMKFLVPCYRKADNVIGFYDTVNDVFYENLGAGDFGKGGNV